MISEIIVILLPILLIPAGICIYKSKIKLKKATIVLTILLVIGATIILSLFPIDNLLKSFPTPEEAVSYHNKEEIGKVILKVYGEESCFINTLKLSYHTFLSKKDDNGWDYCTNASRKVLYRGFLEKDKYVVVYHINGTEDNYVNVSYFSSEQIKLSDNNNTVFKSYIDPEISIYVGYVRGIDKGYILSMNDKDIELGQYME